MEKENKYTTFFFEEYERMAEKNTFQLFFQIGIRDCGACQGLTL